MAQATLCATVEPPAPPLAETKPMVRPMGAAPSAANSSVMAETMVWALAGSTMYSDTPERISSR